MKITEETQKKIKEIIFTELRNGSTKNEIIASLLHEINDNIN